MECLSTQGRTTIASVVNLHELFGDLYHISPAPAFTPRKGQPRRFWPAESQILTFRGGTIRPGESPRLVLEVSGRRSLIPKLKALRQLSLESECADGAVFTLHHLDAWAVFDVVHPRRRVLRETKPPVWRRKL